MKKKLFGIFIGMFSILPIFFVNDIAYAQEDPCEKCSSISDIEAKSKCVQECSQQQQEQGSTTSDLGISLSGECLMGMGEGCFDYEKMIGIKKNQPDFTATSIVQDIIFAATYMVGAVLTLVIIWCGLGYIFASKNGGNVSNYQKGLINAAIGAVLVRGAYAIVRLIQYIAKG